LIPFHINQIVVLSAKVSGMEAIFDDGVQYHTVKVAH
jgi:hypothetical protein